MTPNMIKSQFLFVATCFFHHASVTAFISLSSSSPKNIHKANTPLYSTLETSTTRDSPLSQDEMKTIQKQAERRVMNPPDHDDRAANCLYVSVPERPDPTPITATKGQLPADFPPGAYLRVGPNGASADEGMFDGDGMVHAITFPPQNDNNNGDNSNQMMYTATYLDTKGRQLERLSGRKFQGTLGGVPNGWPMLSSIVQNTVQLGRPQKDTCNTAIAEHGGRLLALMEQCLPTEFSVSQKGELTTMKACSDLNGGIPSDIPISGGMLSAHGRTCPKTGDRIHVSYRGDAAPYLRVDVFSPGWQVKESRPINDLEVPIFSHDCVLTENYIVILDFPLTVRTGRILQNRFPVEYEPSHPARIGLMPRGTDGPIQWYNCQPGVILHASNAWEIKDDKKVIVQALRQEPTPKECYLQQFAPSFLHEYEIDLSTRQVTETTLNANEVMEFPTIPASQTGTASDAVYGIAVQSVGGSLQVFRQPDVGVLFHQVVKLATTTTSSHYKGDVLGRYEWPQGWHIVSEPTVVEKTSGKGEYILLIGTQVPEGMTWNELQRDYEAGRNNQQIQSKVIVLDGNDLDAGPVFEAILPHHVPYGLHSDFVDWKHLK